MYIKLAETGLTSKRKTLTLL